MPVTLNGDGTVTGLAVGGLPTAVVTPTNLSQPLTSGTVQATTSGTGIDFTSIPSWVKKITLVLNGVSTNGTSNLQVQIGAGSVTSSGYTSQAVNTQTGSSATSSGASVTTTGFLITSIVLAANSYSGNIKFCLLGSNIWVSDGMLCRNDAQTAFSAGSVTLAGALDRIRLTTVSGTDTFDAGSVNILYEG